MSRNWKRKIELIFGGRKITLDEFDIDFTYTFNTDEDPNEIEVLVKNMSPTTINTYMQKDNQLILNAGYEGDIGNIAKGFIVDASSSWSNVDKDTTIIGFDASQAYLDNFVSKSYRPGIDAESIIKDLSSMTGLAIGEFQLVRNIQYVNGRPVTGKLRNVLRDIVVNDCKTNFQIINGTVMIRPIAEGLQTGFVLSPDTGLIGSPEPIGDTEDLPVDKRPDYKVYCQLNHRIGCMSRIRIDSKFLKADAVVLNGIHRGSKTGDFITEMEVKLV